MVRDDDVWEFAIFDMEFARRGASELRYVLHYDEAGDVDGFATYRFKEKFDEEPEGEVRIKEVWAEDPAALRQPVALPARPRPRAHLPAGGAHPSTSRCATWSPTPARSSTSITDNLYVRVVDVEAALAARKYAAGVDLVIEIDDPILPANTGRYRIVTDGDPEGSSRRGDPRDVSPDISMGILELGTHLPRRRTPERPAPRPPRHRAHPRRRGRRLDRLRLAPGAVVPGHVLTTGSPGGLSRGEPMTWVLRELSPGAAAQQDPDGTSCAGAEGVFVLRGPTEGSLTGATTCVDR